MDRLDEVAEVLRSHEDAVVTTSEVASEFEDVTQRTVYDDLRLLARSPDVISKKVGANTVVWMHEERVNSPRLAPEEHPDQSPLQDHTSEPVQEDSASRADGINLNGIDIPGEGRLREQRATALRALLSEIEDAGADGTPAPYDEIHEDYPTGYDSATSWRKNCAGPALSQLQDIGALNLLNPARGTWAFSD